MIKRKKLGSKVSKSDNHKQNHTIELVPRAEPKTSKIYLLENLYTGQIRQSKSPIAAPVFFIKKKNSSLKLVQDYRTLNAITIKNKYPLSLISKVVIKLQGAHYFTKLDIHWGFNNVHIKPGDEWKVALCTNCGLFKSLVMFFSITVGSATVKIVNNGLDFYFHFSFYFILFCFSFIFRTTQVRVYQSRCHISHKLMAQSQD